MYSRKQGKETCCDSGNMYPHLLNLQSDRWFSFWFDFLQGKMKSCSCMLLLFASVCFNHHTHSNQLRDSCCIINCKNHTCARDTLFKIILHNCITSGMTGLCLYEILFLPTHGKYVYHNFRQNCHKNTCKYIHSCLNIKWFMTLEVLYTECTKNAD